MISLGFLARVTFLLYAWRYMEADDFSAPEPWYQYAIEGLMVLIPPVLGGYVAEAAQDMHRQEPVGFGGIARAHFLWLWLAAFWYALGLITPMARIYALGPDVGVITTFIVLIVNGLPAAALAIPGYFGLALLSGHHGGNLHRITRNLLGVLVLVLGFLVGLAIQFAWYWTFEKIYEAIFG